MPIGLLQSACPWRTFRWYKGQKHYSGTYWSSTMRDHVIHESRLELTRLLLAAQRRERARIRSEKGIRWGRPRTQAA
ncbi:hypothetical protein ACIHCQ_02965 [Streptomyces sp. NPDC052236]|uniref:hypothetical protein n=1 Tax=Streptomyces sp. NPDC052236 TaxID=3365686 RepID=UPI0037D26A03